MSAIEKLTRRATTRQKFSVEPDPEQVEEFRMWLADRLSHIPKSLNAIEAEAGIRGNALGKFLRGERGRRYSLSPLNIRRLAPVIGVSEEVMLARAGHMSHLPGVVGTESAILTDSDLDYESRQFLVTLYRKLRGEQGVTKSDA